ncbi:LysM peptidoglycan-binding domain-containing protein [Bacillus atrophaeus]|uniref:LysM peptidoglycan-binding domain-containing protein n=1 Tax=Bacillus atrophaeus TaxID=1452 RepID=UPI00228032AF|nr:LysM peptidoglycan-binding domain-containing protein [Bacillus atrophaeus]MCY9196392.1 LysM peptidoglycan-binding domain-containing protein [Bacillus atrophaeus]MDS9997340.1 LysM peptidoglycan-binding domain-containing protein [Bacillus atrophaeus]
MKRLIFLFSSIFVIFIIFYDVKIGTIPFQDLPVYAVSTKTSEQEAAYKTVTVKKGDTVMSIVGNAGSPDEIVRDFEALNPNVKASSIQAGTAYKFPVYRN